MGIVKPLSSSGHWMWLILTFLAVYAPRVFANNCQLKNHNGGDVTEVQWNGYIDLQTNLEYGMLKDTAPAGENYYTFQGAENVIDVKTGNRYFEAVYNGTSVIIQTTDEFPDMKKHEDSSKYPELDLQFTCTGGSRQLKVFFEIEDSNKYPPEMERGEYEYTPAMPLPKGYVLTGGEPIKGKDYDYSTTNILATVDSDFFEATIVKSGKWRDGFEAIIKATKEVRLQEKLVITLKIEDEGTNDDKTPRIVNIPITIDPDLENTVFNPRFKEPLHTVDAQNLLAEEISENLPLVDLIDFDEGYSDDLEYTLEDGGSHDGVLATDFISMQKVPESEGVRIVWKDMTDPPEKFLEKAFALLVLTAKVHDSPQTPSARTVIHIALPGSKIDETTTPEPCPTTVTPTECPICTTPEPCPTTETPTECPICTTPDPCPTTETPTECPICTTLEPDPNPSSLDPLPITTDCPLTCPPVTECPTEGTTTSDCPTCPTECPVTECPSEGTTTSDCPTCPTECPVTECPSEGTTTSDCPTCPTECPVTECPSEGTTTSYCPTCPTECPVTECTSEGTTTSDCTTCPTECPVTECPSEGTTTSECPICPTESPAEPTTTECPVTCPPVTECPSEGSSTSDPGVTTEDPGTTTDPGIELEFEQSSYSKMIASNEKPGSLIAITLKDPYDGVIYSLDRESQSTPLEALSIDDSGTVSLVVPPPRGTHEYYVRAEVPGVGKGRTKLWLHVSGIPTDNKFPNALEVKKVKENSKTLVWREDFDGCISHIMGDDAKYFTLENNVVFSKMIDREDEDFEEAEAPVLRFLIRSCDEENGQHRNTSIHRSARTTWDEKVGNISYDPNYLTVAVVIEDENDEVPTFSSEKVVVGYPDPEAAAALRLSSLLVAEATDRDVGLNAKLRYSLDERGAEFFEVHPESGAVYPHSDIAAVADKYAFKVRATDREGFPGDDGTNTGDLEVTVRSLTQEHLLELHVRGALLEDVDALLSLVSGSGASKRQLRALSSVVLPGDGDSNESGGSSSEGSDEEEEPRVLRRRRSAQTRAEDADEKPQSSLRVVVYSIAGGDPEKREDFESEVKRILSEEDWESDVSAPDLTKGKETVWKDSSNSGLLAAVITLGVLLGLLLLGVGVAGYWFVIRPRKQDGARHPLYEDKSMKLSDSEIAIEPLSEDFLKKRNLEMESREEVSPNLDIPEEIDIPRPMIIFNDELKGDADAKDVMMEDPVSEAGNLDTINTFAGEQRALPKKSVVFNEDVDCIEIRL